MFILLLLILIIIIIIKFIHNEFKNIGRCCSDCIHYSICHNNSFHKNDLDCPSCDKFINKKQK